MDDLTDLTRHRWRRSSGGSLADVLGPGCPADFAPGDVAATGLELT